jgi:hypothetical protein
MLSPPIPWTPFLMEYVTPKSQQMTKCYEVVIYLENIMKVVTNDVDIIVENENYIVAMIPCHNYCAFILL